MVKGKSLISIWYLYMISRQDMLAAVSFLLMLLSQGWAQFTRWFCCLFYRTSYPGTTPVLYFPVYPIVQQCSCQLLPAVVTEKIFQLLIHYTMCYCSSAGTVLMLHLRTNWSDILSSAGGKSNYKANRT